MFPDQPVKTEKFLKEMGLQKVVSKDRMARSGSVALLPSQKDKHSIAFASDIYNQGVSIGHGSKK